MLISVTEATQIILDHSLDFGYETVDLAVGLQRVLAEDLCADRDFPPFDRVAMDGITIRYEDFAAGKTSFPIQAIQAAGQPPLRLEPGKAIEIMTGAMLAEDADTVIRYEDLIIEDGIAKIQLAQLEQGKNVHRQGKDRQQGAPIVKAGQLLSAAEIGVAATIGKTTLLVKRLPRIAIISTGDELVEVDQTPKAYQIRRSNVYQLAGLLKSQGFDSQLFHIRDEPDSMEAQLQSVLEDFELLILTGGVSKGKFDFLPEVLDRLGVKKLLHRVAQKPGKPVWFGLQQKAVVFGLPGNPVSSFVCTLRYVLPWLRKCLGLKALNPEYVQLGQDFSFSPKLNYFLPVFTEVNSQGQLMAQVREEGGSGNLAKLSLANGVLELPAEQTEFSAGEVYPFWRFRS